MTDFKKILVNFLPETFHSATVRAIKIGIINDTFIVSTASKARKYILQKINHHVFLNIPELMSNINLVLTYLSQKISEQQIDRYPVLILTSDGNSFWQDPDGNYWRLMTQVENTTSSYICKSFADAKESAICLARFQKYLSELSQKDFFVTIHNFHNIEHRLNQFKQIVNEDLYSLVSGVGEHVDYILNLEPWVQNISNILATTPTRIVHNDLKFNNILFDAERRAICPVDYDTMMPGKIAYDFGELARTVACNLVEDDPRYDLVAVRKDYFTCLFQAYFEQTKDFLEKSVRDSIAFAPSYMSLILAIRFLGDYLNGNQYFKVDYADHNRDRGLNQLYLFKAFHNLEDEFYSQIKQSSN